jgi:hypothetical protein
MSEGQLLEMLRQAEARQKQLEYQLELIRQSNGRSENAVNLIRSGGAN